MMSASPDIGYLRSKGCIWPLAECHFRSKGYRAKWKQLRDGGMALVSDRLYSWFREQSTSSKAVTILQSAECTSLNRVTGVLICNTRFEGLI